MGSAIQWTGLGVFSLSLVYIGLGFAMRKVAPRRRTNLVTVMANGALGTFLGCVLFLIGGMVRDCG